MTIEQLLQLYCETPCAQELATLLKKRDTRNIHIEGLTASAPALLFAAAAKITGRNMLIVLSDEEEAAYFYHDTTQLLGAETALFFPTSYRTATARERHDAANEILRTEVLTRLTPQDTRQQNIIVTYPEALKCPVVSQQHISSHSISLIVGQTIEPDKITKKLRELGFSEVDYVYEPGQFAQRGAIIDVFSYSSELPFRIDFFGDDIDSLRTFEVDTQLSAQKKQQITIVPPFDDSQDVSTSLLEMLPEEMVLVTKQAEFISDAPKAMQRVEMSHRPTITPDAKMLTHTALQPSFHKNFDLLSRTLSDFIAHGYRLYMLADNPKQLQRLKDIFTEKTTAKKTIDFIGVEKTLHAGFVDHNLKLCIFTDHQIFDRYHKYSLRSEQARSGKVALTLKEIQQFEVGDYVVHIDHGVGKFGGLVRMPQGDGYQEMIKIIYDAGGAIYVSIHALYKVAKYKAQDNGQPPKLSRLGTGQWERMKERTKSRLKDIARDLIKLYAARRREKGFAFSADSFMQHELEASFLYEDTPDQLKATNDVKADMEQARPMDRLVCGDVGFGKTEIAVRAAFKAACDSKQVAILVPTTVLAYQHFQTFSSRLKDLPVKVDYLTRARSAKQTKGVLADLAAGKTDIIIGTHKLIGKNVKFHDLGLLIIDEEQKFGVATKEKLRQMRTNIDTLTLTATPIPRTLQFSLLGARDLSILQTPPPNRYPIHTEIHTLSPEIISEAINFELSRNGQVYFVNPRINDLQRIADLIHRYVPEARLAVGHGQMKPEELEQIITDFVNHDYDVLLSTTIVENGIDIPNANTIIINGANHFGLSDLHQMRGRVGRSNRRAFCYLLAPPLADLPQESRRRLEALENFSELGSGIQIAMQDLDIRGAGNLLGAEQSGFIADLGYETYQKILSQAMAELRNEERFEEEEKLAENKNTVFKNASTVFKNASTVFKNKNTAFKNTNNLWVSDCTLESDLEMYFPDSYVPSDSERMLLYRELDNLHTDRELQEYRNRLIDRFGPVPHQGEELMRVVVLRRHGQMLGCEKLVLKQGRLTLFFISQQDSPYYQSDAFERILNFVARNPRRCNFREKNGRRSLSIDNIPTVDCAVNTLEEILKTE